MLIILTILLTLSLTLNYILSKKEAETDENIVFFGDSITEGYNLSEFFPNSHIINSGISGNKSDNLVSRLEKDVYKYNPSKVFILIGINDLNNGYSEKEILDNVQKIINGIKTNRMNAKIYIESIYPINKDKLDNFNKDVDNDTIKNLNKKIEYLCNENNITYINIYDTLLDDDNNLKDIYTRDGLHLSDLGYFKVTSILNSYIKKSC